MSLINQALKKVQKDRAGNSRFRHADLSAESPDPSARKTPHPVLWIGGALLLAIVVGISTGLTVLYWADGTGTGEASPSARTDDAANGKDGAETPPGGAEQTAEAGPESDAPAGGDANQSHRELPAFLDQLHAARANMENASESAGEGAETAGSGRASAGENPDGATGAPDAGESPGKPPDGPEADPAVIDWLSQARVSGVRLSPEKENRVLLNNRAYEPGEIVHSGLDIKVLVIQESRILFVDGNGKKYVKRLR